MAKFKKPMVEKFVEFYRGLMRKHFAEYNLFENDNMTEDFKKALIKIKEKNSQIVFESYYIPRAMSAILKEDGYLTTFQGAVPRAQAMMFSDLANGILDEFYRFK